jgi:flagellar protein FlaI
MRFPSLRDGKKEEGMEPLPTPKEDEAVKKARKAAEKQAKRDAEAAKKADKVAKEAAKKAEEEAAKKAKKQAKEAEAKKGKPAEPPSPVEAALGVVEPVGKRVAVPTWEEIDANGNIYYTVRDPYQYVNLHMEEGQLVYTAIEPELTDDERKIMKRVAEAYDVLINVGTVLNSAEDKLSFLEQTFKEILKLYNIKLTDVEYRRLLYNIERDYVGYGKIDTLVRDRLIEDISCNGPTAPVFVYHRIFESIKTNVRFEELELNNFILRLAQVSGRHISILQPIRDAALPDGSRINMTLGKEVTKKGSTFTIRKFRSEPISPVELMILQTVNARLFAFLWVLIEYGKSLLISGGTAAGKTTLLNAISMLIKPESKIVSVEDTPEINLAHPNWIQAVTRVGFGESGGGISGVSGISGISGVSAGGKSAGDINLFDLLISALRQRPEFIIVGEVRGEEAYTLFQAISVGHATMGTIHAASMPELLARVESQPMNVPRVMLANLDMVIFVAAVRKGEEKVRRVRDVIEILGIDPATKEFVTNTVFRWDPLKDDIEYSGRSFQLEKLSKSTGIPLETLTSEVDRRAQLLERMRDQGITNYRDVTDLVRQYYVDKEQLLATPILAANGPKRGPGEISWSDSGQ